MGSSYISAIVRRTWAARLACGVLSTGNIALNLRTRLDYTGHTPPRRGDERSSLTVRTCLEPKPVVVSASQGAAFDTSVCVFGFFGVVCVCLLCLFGVGPTPLPRLVWVGFILSAPPWPPLTSSPYSRVCWPFPFQIPTINSCVCVEGRGEKIPRKRFLFGETEKGRERERERVGRSRHVMSCHVMSW